MKYEYAYAKRSVLLNYNSAPLVLSRLLNMKTNIITYAPLLVSTPRLSHNLLEWG